MSKKKAPQPEQVRVEYMPLLGMAPAPRNPKRHEVESIKASMRRFGFVAVPAINETTGRLVAGHGRREALIEMKAAGELAPARIQVRDGEWFVPVLRGVAFATDQEAEAYLLADNRLTEIGGWDEAELVKILGELQAIPDGLIGVGYDEKALAKLLGDAQTATDQSAELRENFQIVVTCVDESHQSTLLERFTEEGLKCRALI